MVQPLRQDSGRWGGVPDVENALGVDTDHLYLKKGSQVELCEESEYESYTLVRLSNLISEVKRYL
jgi:hypothetical protein